MNTRIVAERNPGTSAGAAGGVASPLALVVVLTVVAVAALVVGCSGTDVSPDAAGDDVLADAPAADQGPVDTVAVPCTAPVINEVAPRGIPDDWFELYNPCDTEISLDAFSFADRMEDDGKAVFFQADTVIGPHGYLVARFDDSWPGFRLGDDESLVLFGPDGDIVDSAGWQGISLPPTQSLGRMPDGSGDFGPMSCVTPGAPNTDGVCHPIMASDILFDHFRVVDVAIELSESSIQSLTVDQRTWVPGKVRIQVRDNDDQPEPAQIPLPFDSGTMDVGVRLKGRWGSMQTLDGKAAFKIKFDWAIPDGNLLMLEDLVLNNMVQDCSMIHEHLSYRLFDAFGIPVPRTGWASVTVNGEPYGTYLLLEKYDGKFFDRFYSSTAHVFEGSYGIDILPGAESHMEVKDGDTEDVSDLTALINAVANRDDATWMNRLSGVASLDQFMRVWAVEQYIGHWDGYAPTINNYFLRSDDNGYFTMHPWGLDQTWNDVRDLHDGRGEMFARCMSIPECREKYDAILAELLPIVDSLDIPGYAVQLSGFIRDYAMAEVRSPCGSPDEMTTWTTWFIDWRRREAQRLVPCFLDGTVDQDGDGAACSADCDDLELTINPGAADKCFDWIDQDCSGLFDDGPTCPDCRAFWRGPHRYLYCTFARSHAEAVAACDDVGAALAVINTPEEQSFMLRQMPAIGMQDFWIGLDDTGQEGVFGWADGAETGVMPWAPGQPDDAGGNEDCVRMSADGLWFDDDCAAEHNVLCEVACKGDGDGDGDGHSACGDDCDDGNGDIRPGADEICFDWIDQDCDGLTDGLPDCYVPVELPLDVSTARGSRFTTHALSADAHTARAICRKYGPGADLVWFDDLVQEQVIAGLLRGWMGPIRFWTGINDLAQEGTWVRGDGESPGYLNWDLGQPDDADGFGDCVENTVNGAWNDTDCRDTHTFVCRQPL